jgi:Undecaprenyl-phosphate glucose phosphotransferase
MLKRHANLMIALLAGVDLAVTALAWLAAYLLRFHAGLEYPEAQPPSPLRYLPVMVVSLVLALLVFARFRLYQPRRTAGALAEAGDLLAAAALTWVLTAMITYFFQRELFPRGLLLIFLVAWPTLLIVWRGSARAILRALRRRGWNLRSAAIVGAGRSAQTLFHQLRKMPWTGIEVRYFVGDDADAGQTIWNAPVVAGVDRIEAVLADDPVDLVYVALPPAQPERTAAVLEALATEPVSVRVVPDLLSFHFLNHRVSQLGPLPVIDLTHSPLHGWPMLAKRALDTVGAAALLVVLSPLLLTIAAAVKLTSPGPAIFRQRRASLGGQTFQMLKFRTMRSDLDDADQPRWTTRDDPRVTRLGRLLRKTSLDELPQLLNVLTGDMSLVGPRPERPELVDRFSKEVPRYMLRCQVRAGITGWAQVHGLRGDTSLRKRVQYDMYYINNWSFGLDLRILALTLVKGFINPNAY